MKLVASLIVRNELGRYLEPCVGHLLEFVDEIRVLDDGSDDYTFEWLARQSHDRANIRVRRSESAAFFEHEGRRRQELLDFTLESEPTHVLNIDADEFVSDGQELRRLLETGGEVWMLEMVEVWKAFEDCICVRYDGGWRPHDVPILWRVPAGQELRIRDAALACGREPEYIRRLIQRQRANVSGVSVFHFGWANELERAARFDRYAVHDGGKFHRSAHLDSIMWPDERTEMEGEPWPAALEQWRPIIVAKGGR